MLAKGANQVGRQELRPCFQQVAPLSSVGLIVCSLALFSCGGGGDQNLARDFISNSAPVADAGDDQTVQEFALVTLSGSSTDAEEDEVSYSWTQTGGPSVSTIGENSPTLEFTAPDVEELDPVVLTFRLTVSDPGGLSNSDEVQVTVEDPVATLTTYCHGGFNRIFISNDSGVETYEIAVQALGGSRTQVTGSRSNDKLLLSGIVEDFSFNYEVVMAEDQSAIRLRINATRGDKSFLLNEYGTLGDCERYGGELEDLPKLVKKDVTDVAGFIEDISYFRSSAGHDYSDIFEPCRSMKHYFSPIEEERKNTTVPIYSPFDGTIVQLNTEEGGGFVDDGITNQRVMILSLENASMLAVIFHVDLHSTDLVVGTSVEAGQQLGHARMESHRGVAHDFDIAMHVHTPDGLRFKSYFDMLTDDILSGYSGYGLYPSDFIITETQRNSDPLTCEGENFTTKGSLPSWIFDI